MVPAFTTFFVAVSTATPVLSAAVMSPIAQRDTGAGLEYDPSVIGTPAWDAFQAADVLSEIDADTDATNVFVLQCVDATNRNHACNAGGLDPGFQTAYGFDLSVDHAEYNNAISSWKC
ncbi:hypothetical protein COL922a_011836 [Colletotrichum nupharicola]|nr:hypothetical protein COL922a_011836 [Colletotrichum nupharicola]